MGDRIRSAAFGSAAALMTVVATQLFYVLVVANAAPDTALRPATWLVEVAAFAFLAVAGLVVLARSTRHPFAWGAIAIGSVFNTLQSGIGLSMFGPATEASDPQVMATILSGAFFFYFLGKVLYGLAATGIGLSLLRERGGTSRAIGAPALLSGLAAVVLNILAMSAGRDWLQWAGGAGTLATAFLAIAILVVALREAD